MTVLKGRCKVASRIGHRGLQVGLRSIGRGLGQRLRIGNADFGIETWRSKAGVWRGHRIRKNRRRSHVVGWGRSIRKARGRRFRWVRVRPGSGGLDLGRDFRARGGPGIRDPGLGCATPPHPSAGPSGHARRCDSATWMGFSDRKYPIDSLSDAWRYP